MDERPVWWCPELRTVLANEEVVDGRSEMGGHPVERRNLRQWVLRITAYAERLLALPPFLLSAQGGLDAGDIGAGMTLTGHFLEAFVFAVMNRPLPPARVWLIDRLRDAGRL